MYTTMWPSDNLKGTLLCDLEITLNVHNYVTFRQPWRHTTVWPLDNLEYTQLCDLQIALNVHNYVTFRQPWRHTNVWPWDNLECTLLCDLQIALNVYYYATLRLYPTCDLQIVTLCSGHGWVDVFPELLHEPCSVQAEAVSTHYQ